MIVVLRWLAFILGTAGIAETAKLGHKGRYREAYLFLLFDVTVVIVFVLSSVIVEWLIDKLKKKESGGPAWWRGR